MINGVYKPTKHQNLYCAVNEEAPAIIEIVGITG